MTTMATQPMHACALDVARALLDHYHSRYPGRPRCFFARSKHLDLSSQGVKAAGMRYLHRRGVAVPHSGNGKHTMVWKVDVYRLRKLVDNGGEV